uniref:Adenine DNA glycosylase n=1 Tax=Geotrypetes seraphini TaxID=260995 RepID=A0A6P8NUQ2_GEOSA|nr:adenine DNA glycosylase isoform X2 [Geotrypetes seraphini]
MNKVRTASRIRKAAARKENSQKHGEENPMLQDMSCPRSDHRSSFHLFTDALEIASFRRNLLSWYELHKRNLPWRKQASSESNLNKRAYAVWVSEVMLQQTQVATVIDYYNRWMKKWPTLEALAKASLEATGVVDGNVIRVLCRVRCIGEDPSSPAVMAALWSLADSLVDPARPGDFNQALMELGALLCTPKTPLCAECPVKSHCRAYKWVQKDLDSAFQRLKGKGASDIEECAGTCPLCLPPSSPWSSKLGVTNFPRKSLKKQPRLVQSLTCVPERRSICGEPEYLLTQRPSSGLLAGMWEFPGIVSDTEIPKKDQERALSEHLAAVTGGTEGLRGLCYIGEVLHMFSHIHQTYLVYSLSLDEADGTTVVREGVRGVHTARWVTKAEFQKAAVSTAMKKIFKMYENRNAGKQEKNKIRKRKQSPEGDSIKPDTHRQLSLKRFFKPATK